MKHKFEMGTFVKDIRNGFSGYIVGICEENNGIISYGISPDRLSKTGEIQDTNFIDELYIQLVKGKGVISTISTTGSNFKITDIVDVPILDIRDATIYSRIIYATGCSRYALISKKLKKKAASGELGMMWVDGALLKMKKVSKKVKKSAKTGGVSATKMK